jgi:hypothetical protein
MSHVKQAAFTASLDQVGDKSGIHPGRLYRKVAVHVE